MAANYDPHFYDVIREGARRSVDAAIPIIAPLLDLDGDERTILDVGCGEGWWADGFARLGHIVTGIDDGYSPHRPDTFRFVQHDLMNPIPGGWGGHGRFQRRDLVVCLEVAEHLPPRRADSFIRELCQTTDTVLFSAAVPGQGGTGHVNEQWPAYWVDRFEDNGFAVSGALRWHLWGNPDIENWYQQNLLVAMRQPTTHPLFENELLRCPHAVIHPVLYDARRPQ